ncbi:MAG: CCA tRNA nucleotidyltransferase [Nitrospirae bacterium]|nr:CCA tRNA nucleotidyltransferase [Nitrospirota bacterium]
MLDRIPEGASRILRRLREKGHQALLVGGCVRDQLLGLPITEPKQYDIATSATPDEIMKLFERTVPVGAQFGVILVLQEDGEYEVATFRKDEAYADGRHPDAVNYSQDPREDASRRDFTINGLFYDPIGKKIHDFVGGEKDLHTKCIRAIGDARGRLREDRLRIMRALRFAARLGFDIHPETAAAVRELAALSVDVSAERLRDELVKMMTHGPAATAVELMRDFGVLHYVLPEVETMIGVEQPPEFHPEGDVYTHTLLLLRQLKEPSATLAFGALLHDVGKPPTFKVKERIRFDGHTEVGARMADQILRRLKFPNDEREKICDLVAQHLRFKDAKNMRESTLKRFLRMDNFTEHLELHRIDCLACHGDLSMHEFCKAKLAEFGEEEIRPPRLLTGDDLISIGLEPGPNFKDILEEVETAQLEGRLRSRDEALTYLKTQVLPRL